MFISKYGDPAYRDEIAKTEISDRGLYPEPFQIVATNLIHGQRGTGYRFDYPATQTTRGQTVCLKQLSVRP